MNVFKFFKMKFRIKESFALKLSLYTIACVIIIFIGVLIYNYQISKKLILENSYKNVEHIAESTLNRIETLLIAAQKVPEDLASFIEYSTQNQNEFLNMLRSIVETNPEIYGSTVSFEPYMFDKNKELFAPYFYKSNKGIRYVNLATVKYDYLKWEWYKEPKKLGYGVWSEPYLDEGGGDTLMVTYSQPIYKYINGKKEFLAVATCDIALDWLEEMISQIKIFDTGYAYILSSKGKFIAHPNKEYYTKGVSYYDVANNNNDPIARQICEDMTSRKAGFTRYYSYNRKGYCYVYFQPLKETGWSLAIVIPEDELYSNLQKTTLELMSIGLMGYILTLIMIIVLANIATTPLRSLAKATIKIGSGDFNAEIPKLKSVDEIGVLSDSFLSMQNNLIKYVTNLKETTAAKERIERELIIGKEIQQSLLPHDFPTNKEFDLFAKLLPAKEVAGDLYDFFFIDNKRLCFAIGDVSGKGVSAALFMAITKTLLRSKIGFGTDIASVISEMNKALSRESETSMFVTFFMCILNVETGELECCNAGHNPPLIKEGDTFRYLIPDNPSPPLGVFEETEYTSNKLKLKKNDIFCLYTDGITEAMSKDNIQFTDEKLLEIAEENKKETVEKIVENILTSVASHASSAEQSDDITILVLKYNG